MLECDEGLLTILVGVSVTDAKRDDIDKALTALKDGLAEVGYKGPNGSA